MRYIAIILILCLCTSFTPKEDPKPVGCIKLDIMLLADLSSSIEGREQFIHDAAYAFVDKFQLAEDGIRIGFVTFSSLAYLHAHLTSDKDSLRRATSVVFPRAASGSTNLLHALQLSSNELLTNGRPTVIKMIIIITDGEPDDPNEVFAEAALIKSFPGTMIWGIFVNKGKVDYDHPMMQMMMYSVPPSNTGSENLKKIASPNCYVESNYENLVKEIQKMDICL